MEVKNLRQLKKALNNIPDSVLSKWGVGVHEEEFLQLLLWIPEDDAMDVWDKYLDKYPELGDINSWIENISKASIKYSVDEDIDEFCEEPISSEDEININGD